MKINKILIAIGLFGLSSCDAFLDLPEDVNLGVTKDQVFFDNNSTLRFLNVCYYNLQDNFFWNSQGLGRNSINAASDEAVSLYTEGSGNSFIGILNSGEWIDRASAPEVGFDYGTGGAQNRIIPSCFEALRVANIVIKEVNAGAVKGLTAQQNNEILGQAYFFRAWYYFQLISRLGGMPAMNTVFAGNDDYNGTPRLTYHQSHELVEADLQEAIKRLPVKYNEDEKGRVTKIAAMSVLEMTQLYDASPLMQNDLNSTVVKPYDQERCKKAAKSANEVLLAIDKNEADGARLMRKDEYKNIFYTPTNKLVSDESIWYRNEASPNVASSRIARGVRSLFVPERFAGGTGNDAASFNPPTQNIVEMYETYDSTINKAYPINHPSSGYDEKNPFINRDPRFYNNIIVPGQKWGFNGGTQLYMEMYEGGQDQLKNVSNAFINKRTITGYVGSKFWSNTSSTFAGQTTSFQVFNLNTIYIRVAQIYLDMAEAMNEAYGPTGNPDNLKFNAVQALNVVRNRVGMPDLAPEFFASKEVLRERIRNERAVELMHENHRWHDIRRWMIAHELFSDSYPLYRIKAIPENTAHATVVNKSTLKFKYEKVKLNDQIRIFRMRNYWYPIDRQVVQRFPILKQNPGW
ncbi:MAG: RagB/SusD family nutrient uptake outer membrane protein [Pseudarcicella sp.]|nr:RagB/SusD family nutrient uptake outer membrane protein [Pseudarcicella sp.]